MTFYIWAVTATQSWSSATPIQPLQSLHHSQSLSMPPPGSEDKARSRLQQQVLTATSYFLHVVGAAAVLYQDPNYWKQPFHTSALSGQAWVEELMDGHPDWIYHELGMHLHVFLAFVANLWLHSGLNTTQRGITLEEQAAIFFYACVTGLSVWHLGERFQHSNETISK